MAEKALMNAGIINKGQAKPVAIQAKKALRAMTVKLDEEMYRELLEFVSARKVTEGRGISSQRVFVEALREYLDKYSR
jgi:polyhydroxyalkanoate synthesis regulator phasin